MPVSVFCFVFSCVQSNNVLGKVNSCSALKDALWQFITRCNTKFFFSAPTLPGFSFFTTCSTGHHHHHLTHTHRQCIMFSRLYIEPDTILILISQCVWHISATDYTIPWPAFAQWWWSELSPQQPQFKAGPFLHKVCMFSQVLMSTPTSSMCLCFPHN